MDAIWEIVGKILAAAVVGIVAILAPKVVKWMNTNMWATSNKNIQTLVKSFVEAAEQLFHDDDPTGEKRNQFVRDQLAELGIEVTQVIINMIEGAVWEVNNANRLASK